MSLMQAIAMLEAVFDKYAKAEGDSKTLTKKELSTLLRAEFGMDPKNQAEVDSFFKSLDGDGDGVVNYMEYITFVATLAAIFKDA